jgi:hypothetical protein
MLPVQPSQSAPGLRGLNFFAFVPHIRAWIRQELVDDDPWDVETLYPDAPSPEELSQPSRVCQPSDRQQ